jgi:hypothetical protein
MPIYILHLGIFCMLQICDMDWRLYFPSEGRRAEDFFALENSDGFGQDWTHERGYLKAAHYL